MPPSAERRKDVEKPSPLTLEHWVAATNRYEYPPKAEGPRPRTIPGPEAWYWLDRWCRREGVDLSTWDCYS